MAASIEELKSRIDINDNNLQRFLNQENLLEMKKFFLK